MDSTSDNFLSVIAYKQFVKSQHDLTVLGQFGNTRVRSAGRIRVTGLL